MNARTAKLTARVAATKAAPDGNPSKKTVARRLRRTWNAADRHERAAIRQQMLRLMENYR